jgi:hypothetical protein
LADTGGAERHPVDTERLMEYWAHGEGAAKIGWFTDGAFERCKVELGKHVSPGIVHGLCANLAHRATGMWPGSHGYKASHGHEG